MFLWGVFLILVVSDANQNDTKAQGQFKAILTQGVQLRH
jgi:hypothetical protein